MKTSQRLSVFDCIRPLLHLDEATALQVARDCWRQLSLEEQVAITLDEDFWSPRPRLVVDNT